MQRFDHNQNHSRPAPLKSTRQRQVILEELRKVTSHPTADKVYQMVRKQLPRISMATVYRNLEMMAETGQIQRIPVPDGPMSFDGDISDHHHIRCRECGRIFDVPKDMRVDVAVPEELGLRTGFDSVECFMQFTGVCPDCKK